MPLVFYVYRFPCGFLEPQDEVCPTKVLGRDVWCRVFSEKLFHGLARTYPGSSIWGDVRYGAVVLLVDIDYPVETVSERLLEPVSVFDFGRAPGIGSVVVWRCVGDH